MSDLAYVSGSTPLPAFARDKPVNPADRLDVKP